MKNLKICTLLAVLLLSAAALPAQQFDFLKVGAGADHILFETKVAHDGLDLRVGGPNGLMIRQSEALFRTTDAEGNPLPDGTYVWELRLAPVLSDAERAELQALRGIDDDAISARLADRTHSASGAFSILNGSLVNPDLEEVLERLDQPIDPNVLPTKDQVFNDDVIMTFSLCVGNDCVNGESFGFDTLRLKENNLRIHFQDTSNTASFPSVDWRIVANDTSNGGSNHFSIEDSTTGRSPFRVEAGAPANTLVVEADGDIGVKTLDPVVDIHVVEGNTPTLRLEQDGSDGFTPQTYDMAANEANFFLRDVTNGSKLFFRSKPGAPEDSIFIAADGKIGMGTDAPSQRLHLRHSALTAIRLNNTNALNAASEDSWDIAGLNNGNLTFSDPSDGVAEMTITSDGNLNLNSGIDPMVLTLGVDVGATVNSWTVSSFSLGSIVFSSTGSGVDELTLNRGGGGTLIGTLTETSDVNAKENFANVDSMDVLRKVVDLPLTTWNFKADPASLHLGPMAQDFYASFGLGGSEIGIQSRNVASVALAAVQGLNEVVEQKDDKIDELEARIAALEALVEKLASED